MPHYLVAIHHPDDFDGPLESEATDARYRRAQRRDGGCRCPDFRGRPHPRPQAKSLRAQPDGKVLATDGPYLETKEHIGGFWVLEAADLDEALAWGRKAVVACRAPVEVRAFGNTRLKTDSAGSDNTAGDAAPDGWRRVPRARSASLRSSGITWLIENRGHP